MSEERENQLVTDSSEIVSQEKKQATDNSEENVVKYSTHKKLLNQLKNKGEELESLREFKRNVEEEEAKRKGDFETLMRSREERINELESKLTHYEQTLVEGQKLQAFVDKLPGKIKRQEFLSFVDLEDIALDPETNRVDGTSLDLAVGKFVEKYGDLIETSSKNGLPKVKALGGRPNVKRNLKEMTREELRAAYLSGQFKDEEY